MSVKKNIEFHRGETWIITFACHKADNTPMDISGANLFFRVSKGENEHLMTKTVGDGITLTDAANGTGVVAITEADQDAASIGEKKDYNYELKVVMGGVTSIQNVGVLKVLPSLFYP